MKKQRKPKSAVQNATDKSSSGLLIGAYCRVSTDEQANVVEGSLDNQRHRMASFAEMKNHQQKSWGTIVEFYVDDGFSAKDTNRPAYQRLMNDLKRGKIDTVMVTEISRLSRNIPDFSAFLETLGDHNAEFFSIKEQFDTSTPVGKMMLYNMINLAQFEREQTSERVAINCHSRAMRGLLNGGRPILGYDKHPDKKTTFVVNEVESAQVREIFKSYLENRSLSRTILNLEARGIRPKASHTPKHRLATEGRWTTASLSFVLKNLSYVAKKEVNKGNKDQDQRRLKPWQQYTIVAASWPPIIDEGTFSNVQELLKENKDKERNRLHGAERRVFIASGLLKCGHCGRALVGTSAHGAKQIHRYYVHSQKPGDVVTCAIKRHSADEIESAIADRLCEMLVNAGHFDQVTQKIRECLTVDPKELKRHKNAVSMELQKINLGIQRTFKIQAELDADSEAIRLVAQELQDLGRKKKSLADQLEKLNAQEFRGTEIDDSIDDLKERIAAFKRGWKKATPMAKKSLLADLIYGVVVTDRGLAIEYRLKHGLNSNGVFDPNGVPVSIGAPVIDLAEKRRTNPLPNAIGSGDHNLGIENSQVVKSGSGRGN